MSDDNARQAAEIARLNGLLQAAQTELEAERAHLREADLSFKRQHDRHVAEIGRLRAPAGDAMEAAREAERWINRWTMRYSTTPGHVHSSDLITYLAHVFERRDTAAEERVKQAGWRCFHCGEYFDTEEAALEHFGPNEMLDASCQIDIAKYREMETLNWRHLAEDSDADRRYYKQQAEHTVALRQEEEKGYARGLRDGNYQTGVREGIEMAAQWHRDKAAKVRRARGNPKVMQYANELIEFHEQAGAAITALLPAAPKEEAHD